MMHDRLAEQSFVPTLQRGVKAHAVFGGIVGQFCTEDVRAGCEQVGEADQLAAGEPSFDAAGPADDERNAMPAVKNIRLRAAEVAARVVSLGFEFFEFCLRRTTVVAGENHERAFGKRVLVEHSQNLTDTPIDLHYEIAIRVEAA